MLTVGEVISALVKCASNEDEYLMSESIYGITVKDNDSIYIEFVDANTKDYNISIDGEKIDG